VIEASALAATNDFFIPLFAVDDHPDEMKEATRETKKWHIKTKIFETAVEWAPLANKSDENTILITDNHLQGVNNLGSLNFPDISTARGADAGLRLLTSYCEEAKIRPGLKVLLTQFPLDSKAKAHIDRLNNGGTDKIYVFKKTADADMQAFGKLLREFSCRRHSEFVRKKLDYVRDFAIGWKVDENQLANLFGMQDASDPVWEAVDRGTTSRDIEARCDLLYRMKLNLVQVYGSGNTEQEARWLRTKIRPLGNATPLEVISGQSIGRMIDLIAIMEGNL
jgi:Protein of unknown function (DUF2384)